MGCQNLSNLSNASDNPDASAVPIRLAWGAGRDLLLPFLLSRAMMLLIGCLALRHMGVSELTPGRLVEAFSRFDGTWYLSIARDGYNYDPAHPSSIAFAPLLPLVMRSVGHVLGGTDMAFRLGGLLVSNLALLVGLVFVRAIAWELFGERVARRAVAYVLLCPGTVFLSAVYPMSLMLAISAAALWAARRGKLELAGAIGMLAPLARPDGVMLFVPLLIAAGKPRDWHRSCLCLLMIPGMLGIWILAQWLAFGSPIAFVHAQQTWDLSPWITVIHSSRAGLMLSLAGVFAILTVVGWWNLPASYSAYSSIFLLIALSMNRIWSLPRFVVILFPCLITLAWAGTRWKWIHLLYLVAATILAAIFTLRFAMNLWVA